MPATLVSVYDRLPAAAHARDELLACGFDIDAVHLNAREDEAGAMKSNFTVGNSTPGLNQPSDKFGPDKDQETYANGYADPKRYAEILLTVDTMSDQQTQRATDILQRCGAVRVEQQ
jgi:hypothetical protein